MHIGHKIEMRVVTLGLDDAGKTSILFKMKQNEFITTIPTIGKYQHCCEKTCLQGFGPGPTQTRLYGHRRWIKA